MPGSWLAFLRQDEAMLDDFMAWLDERKAQWQDTQDTAATWEEAKEALGAKKSLDQIQSYVKVSIQEEHAHVAYTRAHRPKSS